jgi:predicted amidohydrolase YtcJ
LSLQGTDFGLTGHGQGERAPMRPGLSTRPLPAARPEGKPAARNAPARRPAVLTAPDLVLVNARIATLDPAAPACTALAALFGRVIALGDDSAVRDLAGRGTRVVDAGGARVVPGRAAPDLDLRRMGLRLTRWQALDGAGRAAALGRIAACQGALPPGRWLGCHGFAPGPDGWPTRQELDDAVGLRPVVVLAADGQAAMLNTAALVTCGWHVAQPDPPGGALERAQGGLTGKVHGAAVAAVEQAVDAGATARDVAAGLDAAQAACLARGITLAGARMHSTAEVAALRRRARLRILLLGTGAAAAGDDWFVPVAPDPAGSLAVGSFADCAVLEAGMPDPAAATDVRARITIVGGAVMHPAALQATPAA